MLKQFPYGKCYPYLCNLMGNNDHHEYLHQTIFKCCDETLRRTSKDLGEISPSLPLPSFCKRSHSLSPASVRTLRISMKQTNIPVKKYIPGKRCQSLSPAKIKPIPQTPSGVPSDFESNRDRSNLDNISHHTGKESLLPQPVVSKLSRLLCTKKREFNRLRKNLITHQNNLLEVYAQIRDLEVRANLRSDESDSLGEVRILSVTGWTAHDLLMLVRDDFPPMMKFDINGVFGPQVLQQLYSNLAPIPEEIVRMGAELMATRIDLLNLMRNKRLDRSGSTNLEWKTKNQELDLETEKLHKMVAGTAENLKAKISYSLELSKIPWIDRDTLIKKIERLQREIIQLQYKAEESKNSEKESPTTSENNINYQPVKEELEKERAAREALKEVVSGAEGMLRVARARISALEKQLKDTRNELETARKKHKDLEQLYKHRESSYDARSKKLLEVSKTGEMTIETLSRQRDALELRVKELHDQQESSEKASQQKIQELRAHLESLQSRASEQDKMKNMTEARVRELEAKVRELEESLHDLRERSTRLVELEKKRCVEYTPGKEMEPTERETELYKELQTTKLTLTHTEEELRQCRADKENFLLSLSKIAKDGPEDLQDKIAAELLDKEKKIGELQRALEEQRENEKLLEQGIAQYESKIASLKHEIRKLRQYECYSREIPFQDIDTELLELNMQVQTLTRERSALITAAASRSLMLERHERAACLFAQMTRARVDLDAQIVERSDPPKIEEFDADEIARTLMTICNSSTETWTALREERARVLKLESAVLAQGLQLEREAYVRTQLERRRALLEREILRSKPTTTYLLERNVTSRNNNS